MSSQRALQAKAEGPVDLLPVDLEGERLILGSILKEPARLPEMDPLETRDFSVAKHGQILTCIRDLAARGEAADYAAVGQELHARKQLESAGGLSYLTSLAADLPRIVRLDGYVRTLREAGQRRLLMLQCEKTVKRCELGDTEASEILAGHLSDVTLLRTREAGATAANEFEVRGDGRYILTVPGIGVSFDVDRLRREHHELIGELRVRCDLPGSRGVNGALSVADFNLSSARARAERAKLLAARANTTDFDWLRLVEEFCQRVLEADRAGQPSVDLREVAKPTVDATGDLTVDGFTFFQRHPTIIFGDGGAFKSYMGLYLAGRLAERGLRVGFFDWELAAEDHRERLERLFPDGMPEIRYVRCERPLVAEADRLRGIVRDQNIAFSVFDSIALASDGPPEAAEVAAAYFRAVRQIGGGSLHLAHISKSEDGDRKPFGSAFWHNMARATWFIKAAQSTSLDNRVLNLGCFCRKANLGPPQNPVGFEITFDEHITFLRRTNPADNADLAGQLSVRQRMVALLCHGALTPEQISDEIDAEVDTVKRESRRYKRLFVLIPGGKVGLAEGRQS